MQTIKHECKICGDQGIGFNFGVMTCESCKAFFRRNAISQKDFKCPFKNKCVITVKSRKYCQKCRLIKCFQMGMRKNLIMSSEEKQQKRLKRKQRTNSCTEIDEFTIKSRNTDFVVNHISPHSLFLDRYQGNVDIIVEKVENGEPMFPQEQLLDFVSNKIAKCYFEDDEHLQPFGTLTEKDQNRIEELVNASMIRQREAGEEYTLIDSLFLAIKASERQIFTLIRMAKQLSGFRNLEICNQIEVLKEVMKDMFILWNLYVFDEKSDAFIYSTNEICAKIKFDSLKGFCTPQINAAYKKAIFNFQEAIQGDSNLFNMSMAAVLFKPKQDSPQRDYLRKEYLYYLRLMQAYLTSKFQDPSTSHMIMQKILCCLEECEAFAAVCFKCFERIDLSKLTCFYKEMFKL